MKKLFVMAAMVLSSVGAFAQQAAGTTTIFQLSLTAIGRQVSQPVLNCSIRLQTS